MSGSRIILRVSAVFLLVVIGVLFWSLRNEPKEQDRRQLHASIATPTVTPVAAPAPPARQPDDANPGGEQKTLDDPEFLRKVEEAYRKRIAGYVQQQWNNPIEFYGRVVDEADRRVEGARIRLGWTDMSPTGSSEVYVFSDIEGLFSLINVRGKRLTVRVEKEGYYSSKESRGSFEYASRGDRLFHVPDPSNPVVFRLRKKGVLEPLIRYDKWETLAYDRGSYFYDPQSGAISQEPPSGAGLKFTFTRAPSPQGTPFAWTWRIDGVHAALQATDEELAFLAPEGGYVPAWEMSRSAQDSDSRQSPEVRLYLRTADGRYGLVDLRLRQPKARDMGPTLYVKSWLNPSGSRNLEFDPNKHFSAR